jgi:hypothetical protein
LRQSARIAFVECGEWCPLQLPPHLGVLGGVLAAVTAAVVMLAGASVAWADHTHVLILPNGKCAILAAENEKYQILPSVLSVTPERRRR